MMSRERVAFDTNVLVSALLFKHALPGRALAVVRTSHTILVSKPTMQELVDVLSRPKFDRYLRAEDRDEFVVRLAEEAVVIEIAQTVTACRDPKDDKFLELAVNGNATCIVTGDDDLLVLDPFRGVRIVTPRGFLEEFAVDA